MENSATCGIRKAGGRVVTFVANLLVVGGKSQEQPGVDGGFLGNLGA